MFPCRCIDQSIRTGNSGGSRRWQAKGSPQFQHSKGPTSLDTMSKITEAVTGAHPLLSLHHTQSLAGPSFCSPEVASAPSKISTAQEMGQVLPSWMLLLYAPNVFVQQVEGKHLGSMFCQHPHNICEHCVCHRPIPQSPTHHSCSLGTAVQMVV